jgi:hypothetical protein
MCSRWVHSARRFIASLHDEATGGIRSVPGGPATLYGTCYGLLARHYLGERVEIPERTRQFIEQGQDPQTGLFTGPELRNFQARPGALHDREHLQFHLTCAALPACEQFGIRVLHPLTEVLRFCDRDHLQAWLQARDLRRAWFEGNNLLFAGQLLVYARDRLADPRAPAALDTWFAWLDRHADPATSLWGSNGMCSMAEAVYGGYHQLLVYYHEMRPVANPAGLVDAVLGLQHADGGFSPGGNAGACEDVDSVDILVNQYKQTDHRRREIRGALRKCIRHILAQQNPDGGFPYTRHRAQTHMGIPGTDAPANVSAMFPTWFRIHTLALASEILADDPLLAGIPFRFSRSLSMGWHRPWDKTSCPVGGRTSWRERVELAAWRLDRIKDRLHGRWEEWAEQAKRPVRMWRRRGDG